MQESQNFHARRPGWLGVHSLDHIGLTVPDLTEAKTFYNHFGLNVQSTETGLEIRTFGNDHVWMKFKSGPAKQLSHICFGIFPDDLDYFYEKLKKYGVSLTKTDPDQTSSLWFHDPLGVQIEIKTAPKVMPDHKTLYKTISCPPGTRGAVMRGETPKIHPSRLAHALFFTPNIQKSVEFYTDILGLKLSDFPGPVAFLHGAHGSDHHLIAFAQSDAGIGYHHSAWDIASLEEAGLGAAQMAAAGYKRGWGLGRHVLGSNYFNYIRDPWGSYAEYSYDIDYVPAEQNWTVGYPSPDNSLYLWGPDVPADFIVNYERHEIA